MSQRRSHSAPSRRTANVRLIGGLVLGSGLSPKRGTQSGGCAVSRLRGKLGRAAPIHQQLGCIRETTATQTSAAAPQAPLMVRVKRFFRGKFANQCALGSAGCATGVKRLLRAARIGRRIHGGSACAAMLLIHVAGPPVPHRPGAAALLPWEQLVLPPLRHRSRRRKQQGLRGQQHSTLPAVGSRHAVAERAWVVVMKQRRPTRGEDRPPLPPPTPPLLLQHLLPPLPRLPRYGRATLRPGGASEGGAALEPLAAAAGLTRRGPSRRGRG